MLRRTFEATPRLRLRWKSSPISSARRADNSPRSLRNCYEEYDSRLRVVFRNFPLPAHEHAREAALAAEAAGFQGKFWEMHDTLYREQLAWSKAPNARELFESYAGTLGLDMDQFKKDMDSDKARERVDSDHALGDFLGVKVTPTLFINNRPVDPQEKNPEGVRAAINAALKRKIAIVTVVDSEYGKP